MIPHDEINRLRALPIEQVAERLGLHVSRHKSLCPFHPDRHPSLTFSVKRNCYHCFVCGGHGGPIDLAMKLLNKPFGEACRWLADAHNIVLDTVQPAQKPEREYKPDTGWLQGLIQYPMLCDEANRWLYDERHIDPRVVRWCGLSSITRVWCAGADFRPSRHPCPVTGVDVRSTMLRRCSFPIAMQEDSS